MIEAYLIIAVVCGIVLSFLAIIHHFWLRDAFNEEAAENDRSKRHENDAITAQAQANSTHGRKR